MALIIYVLIGLTAGLLGGLLGIGGGLVTVPSLLFAFHFLGLKFNHVMQVVVGTSLAAMVFTAASSALAHIFKKGVNWEFFFALAPGIIVGAILGAWIADILPSSKLELIFGIFMCAIGLYFIFFRFQMMRSRLKLLSSRYYLSYWAF